MIICNFCNRNVMTINVRIARVVHSNHLDVICPYTYRR